MEAWCQHPLLLEIDMSPVYGRGVLFRLANSIRADRIALIRSTESSAILLAASCFLLVASPAAVSAPTKNVLVLYSNSRFVPVYVEFDRGLTSGKTSAPGHRVQFFYESLDRPAFSGDAHESLVTTYLREKYKQRPPDAIVAVVDSALDFLLRKRDVLFPQVPVVYVIVPKRYLVTHPPLPADVVGVPVEYDYLAIVQRMLSFHPARTRLLVVTGASAFDQRLEEQLRRQIPGALGNVRVEFFARQSTAAVLARLSQLGPDWMVFTPGFLRDADDNITTLPESATMMAAAATAPVYGTVNTMIGTGVVAGRSEDFEAIGLRTAQILTQLLAGEPASSLPLPEIEPMTYWVDWRQVRRWGIDEKAIPADTVVYFRDQTLWQAHRTEAITGGAVILLQAALIAMLLMEHGRRRKAESAVQLQRGELWHASRRAIAGELTASIAHEINQPLGAILTNAETGEMLLESGTDRRDDLRRILSDIRRDDLRASDVIRRLRTLLAKHDLERQPFDPNETIGDAMNLVGSEADRRRVTLMLEPSGPETRVLGDRIQIQQVIINLILNAMDAVAQVPDERRVIGLSVERTTHGIVIAVRDYGHGIAPEHLPRLFESFFSTKERGMGLGLSIARTIVESHGGRIWAENDPDFGASFYVELPVHGGNGMSSAKRA
jgi:signal transduction histidine kinase